MKFSELAFYAESEGLLPTRLGKLNAIINEIKRVPTSSIDIDTLVSLLNKNGIEIDDLTQKEFDYILKGIR